VVAREQRAFLGRGHEEGPDWNSNSEAAPAQGQGPELQRARAEPACEEFVLAAQVAPEVQEEQSFRL
jgi:hypothetical protein